jgi:hypothetical protein
MAKKDEVDLASCSTAVLVLFVLIVFISWFTGSGPSVPSVPKTTKVETEYINGTINGYDSASDSIINPINVFKDYENRALGITGKVNHGDRVTISKRSGNGLKIYADSGVTGWVNKEFVRED